LPLLAANPIETQWNQVCRVADGREMIVTTASGETVQGYCISVDVDGVGIRTRDGQIKHVARTALARLRVHGARGHQLSSLGKGVHDGLKFGVDALLSPEAVLGAVAIPATLAWGAVSTPFCILGDLRDKLSGTREIKPI